MDGDLKEYADTLYEDSGVESARILQEDLMAINKAALLPGAPLSGVTVGAILDSYGRHIGRCLEARIDSYERAYGDSDRVPSEQDFTNIRTAFEDVRSRTIASSVNAARQLIGPRGVSGVPGCANEAELTNRTAHVHDHVLRKWHIWKAKVKFKLTATSVTESEKQRDVLLPVYSRAEFDRDKLAFTASSTASSPASLLFMDLDKFKAINDSSGGHAAGDQALTAFTEALLRVCNGKGDVYRYGGDEFCVLLPNYSLDEAFAVAERIRQEVASNRGEFWSTGLSASIGVVCFPESSGDPGELVELADRAMYMSKRAGGNRVSKGGKG